MRFEGPVASDPSVLDVRALSKVVDTFLSGDWTREIITHSANNPTSLSRSASKFAQDNVEASFERGHAGRAFNWAFLLVHFTKAQVLEDSRFCELFRPTKHESRLAKLADVLSRLTEQTRSSGLPGPADTFLSWASFCDLFIEAMKVEKIVLDAIRSTHRALAWLVSYVEEIFAFGDELASPPTIDKQHRFDLGKEETATAVSYLLGRYYQRWGFSARDFPILLRPAEPPDAIADFLLQGYALVEVRSLEPTLFRFGSRCTWVDKRTVEVTHPNDTIDVSLELGYIKTQHAAMSAPNVPMDDRPTFREVCDRFQKELSPKFITYASEGPPRLRIRPAPFSWTPPIPLPS